MKQGCWLGKGTGATEHSWHPIRGITLSAVALTRATLGGENEDDFASSAGSILFNDPVHAGAMSYVSHWVATEVSGAAVPRLIIKSVRTAVPGVVRKSGHAAMR